MATSSNMKAAVNEWLHGVAYGEGPRGGIKRGGSTAVQTAVGASPQHQAVEDVLAL